MSQILHGTHLYFFKKKSMFDSNVNEHTVFLLQSLDNY